MTAKNTEDTSKQQPLHVAPRIISLPHHRKSAHYLVKSVVIVTVIGFIICLGLRHSAQDTLLKQVKSKQYQSVSLTNGQVYFGKIATATPETITLHDVYYLKVQQLTGQPTDTLQQQNKNFSLTKLGSEVHGPEDTLFIERKQMLFWENLKDDSEVVKAIANDKK